MITFFTTAKKFEGNNKDSQLNAIRSWLSLSQVEIIIFEKPDGAEFIPKDDRIKIIEEPELKFGIPRIDYMFDYISNHARNKLSCYINADIILTKEFLNVIENLNDLSGNFLAVGQRYDFDNNNGEWNFSSNWEKDNLDTKLMKIHPPAGSDFFIFPSKQYNKLIMPPLIVGRAGWDNWMIYDSRRRKIPTIDISLAYKVFHQNHDYSHKKGIYKNNLDEPETQWNLFYLPEDGKYDFTLAACDYILDERNKLKKSYSRGNRNEFLRIEFLLKRNQFFSKLKFLLFSKKSFLQDERK